MTRVSIVRERNGCRAMSSLSSAETWIGRLINHLGLACLGDATASKNSLVAPKSVLNAPDKVFKLGFPGIWHEDIEMVKLKCCQSALPQPSSLD